MKVKQGSAASFRPHGNRDATDNNWIPPLPPTRVPLPPTTPHSPYSLFLFTLSQWANPTAIKANSTQYFFKQFILIDISKTLSTGFDQKCFPFLKYFETNFNTFILAYTVIYVLNELWPSALKRQPSDSI